MNNEDIRTGTIVKIFDEKGYGFIKDEDKKEIFFHARNIVDPTFKEIKKGMEVNYLIKETSKGTEAISVVAIQEK